MRRSLHLALRRCLDVAVGVLTALVGEPRGMGKNGREKMENDGKYSLRWVYMELYGVIWFCMVLYGLIWSYMVLYGLIIWSGFIWFYMVLFLGQPWLDTKVLFLFAINGKISPNQQKN
jgi:hypothetical protein